MYALADGYTKKTISISYIGLTYKSEFVCGISLNCLMVVSKPIVNWTATSRTKKNQTAEIVII